MLQNDYYIDINRPVSRQKIAELITKIKTTTTPKNLDSEKKHKFLQKVFPSTPKSQTRNNDPISFGSLKANTSSHLLKRFIDVGINSSFLLDLKGGITYNFNEISERIRKIESLLKEETTELKTKDLLKSAFTEIQQLFAYHSKNACDGVISDRNTPYLPSNHKNEYFSPNLGSKLKTPLSFSKSKSRGDSSNFKSLNLNLDYDPTSTKLNSLVFEEFDLRRKPKLKNFKNPYPDYLSFIKQLFELRKRLCKSNVLIPEIELDLMQRAKSLREKFRSLYIGEEPYKLWEFIEDWLDEIDNNFLNWLNQRKCEEQEKKKLDEIMKEKILLNRGEVEVILNKPEIDMSNEKNEVDRKAEFEEIFKERIKELENECNLLNENIAAKEKTISHLENRISSIAHEDKHNLKVSKGTQLSFATKMDNDTKKSKSVLLKFISENKNYFKFRFETSYSFVNLILIDKLLEDQIYYHENMNILSFPEFIIKWILKKVGNRDIGKRILSDFLLSILNERHLRFVFMRKLAGIDTADNDIKKIFCQSKGFEIFIRALFLFRKNAKTDIYVPFIPFGTGDNIMFPVEEAWPIFEQILIEEEITEDNLDDLKFAFNKSLTPIKDVPALKKFNNSSSVLSKMKNNQMDKIKVNFDALIEYILEFLSEKFQKKINQLCNNLSIISSIKKNEILFNDFENSVSKSFPRKSKIAIEQLFLKINLKHAKFANLNESIRNNAHLFLERNNENYLNNGKDFFKIKKDLRSTLGTKEGLKSGQNSATMRKTAASNFSNHQSKPSDHVNSSSYIEYYDVFNSILALKDLHQMLELNIVKEENKNEALFMNHQLFKKEFLKLSSLDNNVDVKNLGTLLHDTDKSELVEQLERLWNSFRFLIESLIVS